MHMFLHHGVQIHAAVHPQLLAGLPDATLAEPPHCLAPSGKERSF